ncbi:MAG TPA: hypothetical protein VFL90_16560 [Methylomirabilota bacterium]|nr:hypothetical protein [Methylomirabilota bacterium]
MTRGLRTLPLLLVALTAAGAFAQGPRPDPDQGFIESLRRDDPAGAERFVSLRDARDKAIADLQQATQRYNAGGAVLHSVTLPPLAQARHRYAETSLALLDFLDAHDRASLQRLQENIERLNRVLEERKKSRAELEKLLHE